MSLASVHCVNETALSLSVEARTLFKGGKKRGQLLKTSRGKAPFALFLSRTDCAYNALSERARISKT